MNCKSGIYQIFNIITHKRYVGSAINLKKRFREHKYVLRHNIHHNRYLQRAWNKYGESNFKFLILEYCTPDLLMEREKYWIDNSKADYNILKEPNSIIGYKHTDETKEKMIKRGKKIWENKSIEEKQKIVNFLKEIHPSNQGLERTEEYRNKISKNMKRPEYRDRLWETKQKMVAEGTFNYKKTPVIQYNKDGTKLQEWNSIKEATNSFGKINNSSIVNACKGRNKTAYGFIWKYKNISL